MTKKPLISRDELLGGAFKGRARRSAQSVLALIEARTVQLRKATEVTLAPEFGSRTSAMRAADYFKTLAQSGGSGAVTTIQDLERFAPQWASLVPASAEIRAVTFKQLAEKYRVPEKRTARLQSALGTGDAAVVRAYQKQANGDLAACFATGLTLAEQLAWRRAGISETFETLPPFWTAFALTTNGMFGPSILAMPIAFAGLGPVLGVAVLITLAFFNLLTFGYMAESCARNSGITQGSGTIGSIVTDFLGPVPAKTLQVTLFVFCALVVFVIFVGFGAALGELTGLSDMIWVAVIFGVCALVLSRKSLNLTITSGLIVGAINLSMLFIMMVLVLWATPLSTYAENFSRVDLGVLGQPSVLTLVFGSTLYALCAQTAVTNCAQIVLKADPSGRSLSRGAMAGFAFSVAFFCAWILVVNGAVPAEELQRETSTSLAPVAARVGPEIHVFGTIYIIFAFGTSAIATGLGVVNMGRELIEDLLNRRTGDDGPARVGDSAFAGRMSGVLTLDSDLRRALAHLIREGAEAETAPKDMTTKAYRAALRTLQAQGYLTEGPNGLQVQAMLRMPKGGGGALDRTFAKTGGGAAAPVAITTEAPPMVRITSRVVLLAPLVVIFLAVEGLYALGLLSFTSALNTVGVLLAPLIAGVFPAILFKAGRSAGRSVPGAVASFLGSWPVVILILALSLTSYLVHALVIWEHPILQAIALAAAAGIVSLICYVLLRGTFRPALLVEVFDDRARSQGVPYSFTRAGQATALPHRIVTQSGETIERDRAKGDLADLGEIAELAIEDGVGDARLVRVNAQTIGSQGEMTAANAWLTLETETGPRALDLLEYNGQVRASLDQRVRRLALRFR